jgi:hypothetical protein
MARSARRVGNTGSGAQLDRDFPTLLAFGELSLPMKGRENGGADDDDL